MNSFMTTLLGALLSHHDQLAVAMLIRARGRFFCLALRTSLQRHHLRRAPSVVQQIGRRAGRKEPLQHLGVASACSVGACSSAALRALFQTRLVSPCVSG